MSKIFQKTLVFIHPNISPKLHRETRYIPTNLAVFAKINYRKDLKNLQNASFLDTLKIK